MSTTNYLQELKQLQSSQGATFRLNGQHSIPMSFGPIEEAITAAETGVALCDRSHWGRIEVADSDRLRFLHNQSTNDFMTLEPGQGCETVFVTSTARTLDLVTAYAQPDDVLLLTHPSCRASLLKWMDRFIFFADNVKLTDRTEETIAFSLIGPHSLKVLMTLGEAFKPTLPFHHETVTINQVDTLVAVGSGLATPGLTLIAPAQQATQLWQTLSAAGAMPIGETVWEHLRVQQGRPAPGTELTEDYNPLEAGLWQTISFNKGCYIGQETIARLDTYDGVKQQLWGVQFLESVEPGTPLTIDDKKVGMLTSVVNTGDGYMGLGYVRRKAGGKGLTVYAGGIAGQVVDIPFVTRSRQDQE